MHRFRSCHLDHTKSPENQGFPGFANLQVHTEVHVWNTQSMSISPDKDGYIDKECPKIDCMSKFKVNTDDWNNLFSDEAVYCPFCGHDAPAQSWWTTEQISQAKEQAINSLKAKIGKALQQNARSFNRQAPKGFITMTMEICLPMFSAILFKC